jgi:hypothetical protein
MIVSTFNAGNYRYRGVKLAGTILQHHESAVFYHENSKEEVPLTEEELRGIPSFDLFEVVPDLERIVSQDDFSGPFPGDKQDRSLNSNSSKWARKPFAVQHAAKTTNDRYLIWCDSDCWLTGPLPALEVVAGGWDIMYRVKTEDSRGRKPRRYPCTSYIIFDLSSNLTRDFIDDWAGLYDTGAVFDLTCQSLTCWADHAVFEYVTSLYESMQFGSVLRSPLSTIIRHAGSGHLNNRLYLSSGSAGGARLHAKQSFSGIEKQMSKKLKFFGTDTTAKTIGTHAIDLIRQGRQLLLAGIEAIKPEATGCEGGEVDGSLE